jgi:hypothetical protein
MVRRSFLQTLGALGAVAGASANPNQKTRFYTLETFFMKNGDQTARLNDFLSNGYLPAAQKVHAGPKLVLQALIAAHMPQFALILGFSTAPEMMSLYTKLHEQEGYNEALARWESGPNPPYERASLTLLEAADYSSEIRIAEPAKTPRLFELRVYHSPTWRQLKALHERFAGPEIQIFHRSGIHPLFYTSTVFGPDMPNLTYLIPFDDLAAREKAWNAFTADPEWPKVRQASVEKHGEITSVIQISLFRATAYSPIR